jgi:uncharacterized membrane protein YqjE
MRRRQLKELVAYAWPFLLIGLIIQTSWHANGWRGIATLAVLMIVVLLGFLFVVVPVIEWKVRRSIRKEDEGE